MGSPPPRSSRVRGVIGTGEIVPQLSSRIEGIAFISEGVTGLRVTAMCDNSTVVAYVNRPGGTVSCSLLLVGQSHSEFFRESRPPPRYVVSTRAVLYSGSSPQPS